jgi:hypothetical protein
MPKCEVTLNVADATGPFGMFGDFESVTFNFSSGVGKVRVLGQDLAGDKVFDITPDVGFKDAVSVLRVKPSVTSGLTRNAGDLSSPGLVIAFE